MATDTIQANYEQLESIAQRFSQQAEDIQQVQAQLRRAMAALQHGDWIGRGAEAFFAEMTHDTLPGVERLQAALAEASRVTLEISQIIQQAEEEAAAPFNNKAPNTVGTMNTSPTNGASHSIPAPRIYIVNGINSEGNVPGARDLNGHIIHGDNESVALELLLEKNGYDPDQVTSTNAIFLAPTGTHLTGTNYIGTNYGGWLTPVDWLTGQGMAMMNTVTNTGAEVINQATNFLGGSVYGSAEVLGEYLGGEHGKYTEQVYNEIANDLSRNPLAPDQTVLLMGHSGGGAVVANLAGSLERNTGVDVSGIVTMGSPVANYDEAGRYAELIVDVRHANDRIAAPLGTPLIRSEESRMGIPLAVAAGVTGAPLIPTTVSAVVGEAVGRISGDNPNVRTVILDRSAGGVLDSHGSYMHNQNVSVDMLNQLNRLYPNLNLQLPASNL